MQVAVGESVLIDESLSDYEALRVFFEVADERGHAAPSVVVDERGVPVTHPDYVDRMGAVHVKSGAWAFCRRPAAEAFGLPGGTDWVRAHAFHLMFFGCSPYLPKPHFYDQAYVQRFGASASMPLTPVCSAQPVAWNNEGSRICVLDERLGHVTDGTGMAGYALWEYEAWSGQRRLVAGFPVEMDLGLSELSYSVDDAWIHLCQWAQGRNLLVRVSDGLVVTLPVVSGAMGWNPREGPNAMVAMVPDTDTGRLIIYDYNLADGTLKGRSELESPTGLPLTVRELSMASDGCSALVTAPVGVSGIDQRSRGGVHIAAVIDIDEGSIELVLPVSFRTHAAQRRHTSPRWCEERSRDASARVTVNDRLMAEASQAVREPDSPALLGDFLQRWTEILEGIEAAWDCVRMPRAQFADEFVQYALSCYDIDDSATDQLVSQLCYQARNDPVAKAIVRSIDSGRHRSWRSSITLPLASEALQVNLAPAVEQVVEQVIATPAGVSPSEAGITPMLDRLIAAESVDEASAAAIELVHGARLSHGSSDKFWAALATLSSDALTAQHYLFVAKAGLTSIFWNAFYRPELARSGLLPAPESAWLALLLNCFEACTHLPERTVIGRDNQTTFDAEDTRIRCQQALQNLPFAEYLKTSRRSQRRSRQAHGAPNPANEDESSGEAHAMTRKRIFISYVREDSDIIDRIASSLRDNGFDVWLDRTHLVAGMKWKSVIRKAIRNGDYFIACFSPNYVKKPETYMNEELIIAVARLRLMHQARHWFIPIMLSTCSLPDYEIGPGERLDDLQYIDFSQNWDSALNGLITAISGTGPCNHLTRT